MSKVVRSDAPSVPRGRSVPATWLVGAGVLLLSWWMGGQAGRLVGSGRLRLNAPAIWPIAAMFGMGFFGLAAKNTSVALLLVLVAAGTFDMPMGTGTQTAINLAMILMSVVTLAWIGNLLFLRDSRVVKSEVNRPLLFFILSAFVSWIIGYAVWNPMLPLPSNAVLVQAAQVAVFVLTATALWTGASVPLGVGDLKLYTIVIIAVGVLGIAASGVNISLPLPIAIVAPPLQIGLILLLSQLLLNRDLGLGSRVLGWGVLGIWALSIFRTSRVSFIGGWAPVAFGAVVVLWFRSKRLLVLGVAACALFLLVYPEPLMRLYNSEGAGGSLLRPLLWWDIIRMTLSSPISILFGLGPVAYKWNWLNPAFVSVSHPYVTGFDDLYWPPAHNMFVDIYAQTGLVGLFLLLWVLLLVIKMAYRLIGTFESGFMRAYVVGVLAGFIALCMISASAADWLIPFVYNIGLAGFRESVYAWILAGTIVGLYSRQQAESHTMAKAPGSQ